MNKKKILLIPIVLIVIILLAVTVWLFVKPSNSKKDNNKNEITKPVDPVIAAVIKSNPSAKAENLEIEKEKIGDKYKVVDKKQSTTTHSIYYLVDPVTNEVNRHSVTKIGVGKEKK